jgi:hypothetical protein
MKASACARRACVPACEMKVLFEQAVNIYDAGHGGTRKNWQMDGEWAKTEVFRLLRLQIVHVAATNPSSSDC